MFGKIVKLAMLCIALAGCGVEANVTVFHQLTPEMVQGKKLAIRGTKESEGSLEFAAFRDELAAKFAAQGFVITGNIMDADMIATLVYGIDNGTMVSSTSTTPTYGQTSPGGFIGSTYVAPSYGVTGYSTTTSSTTVYKRIVSIDILDRATLAKNQIKKLYEGRVRSEGSCQSLAGVMPEMLDALFKDWPGTSGKTQTITIPRKSQC